MASTYSTRLRLELMGSGDQSGTWGTTTNTNLGTLIEAAIAGRAAVSMTDADYTLTVANGTTDEARNMILNISGALTATRNVICPAVSKMYVVKNATTGSQSIVLKTSAGTGVTIGNGLTALVFCDGTNVVEGINRVGDLTVAGTTTQFTATAARIQGDFSNATVASKTFFQDKTTNNGTAVGAIPNGTNTTANLSVFNNSNPTNASYVGLQVTSTVAQLFSTRTGSGTTQPIAFNVGDAGEERARFDTGGRFMVGTTNTAASAANSWVTIQNQINYYGLGINAVNQSGTYYLVTFGAAGTQTGNINSNGTTTIYATVSDYRLKENVQPMTGALAKVQALNPVTYTWKRTQTSGQGFIAHELQAVIPDAVTGVKDDVDDEGNPRHQGMDASHVVATLVAAVKELTARVAALEGK